METEDALARKTLDHNPEVKLSRDFLSKRLNPT